MHGHDVGIRNGMAAVDRTQELKQWLVHPDKLFCRVRDENGLLQLSEKAKAFHPGRGVYRSSYMNARRLAATETNIAYRTADHLRWQQMDFVVGIEICLSNNHTIRLQPGETTDDPKQLRADGTPKANAVRPLHDICDELKGRYPKTFKFTGWHPHCRCYAVSILKTDEELAKDNERILNGEEPAEGSENEVKEVPEGFKEWVDKNGERIKGAKSLPYFVRDNVDYIPTQWRQSVLDAIDKKVYNETNVSLKSSKIKIKGLPAVSDQEVIDTIKEVERVNPDLFRGGLKDVRIINTGKGFMANDRANGTNALNISNQDFKVGNNQTFNPLKELKDAFANIAKNKGNTVLTFNQKYALESLWHEIKHAQAIGWKDVANKTAELTNSMELINQFCARKSYRSFVRSLGGNVVHEKKIMENGFGYHDNVQNFCFLLKQMKVSPKSAYRHFKNMIITKPYEDIHYNLIKYVSEKGKIKIEEANEIVKNLSFLPKAYKEFVALIMDV